MTKMSQMIKMSQPAASDPPPSDPPSSGLASDPPPSDPPPSGHTPAGLPPLARINPPAPPSNLNPRQEEFCREMALDPNATRAALHAGYSRITARSQASRLLSMPSIQARVAQLRRDITARDCAHAESFMAKLEAIYRQAFEHCHLHAALRAVEMQMRLASYLPDSLPDSSPGEPQPLPPPSPETAP
ncbi:MAG: terminase small subunit [Alphaproteobacteria bacterium]|nr:terminase small subunit [Alphaproteobacteria bacterium]